MDLELSLQKNELGFKGICTLSEEGNELCESTVFKYNALDRSCTFVGETSFCLNLCDTKLDEPVVVKQLVTYCKMID